MDGKNNGNGNAGVGVTQEEQKAKELTFVVDKWVDDRDLEAILNKRDAEGYEIEAMFRNGGNVETTTIVWRRSSHGMVGSHGQDDLPIELVAYDCYYTRGE